ncbi:S8 family serine peptidase [Geodermatophilus normandii]|uniref:S8 family serine peptidase n=1 Tax=Geodermatophilus normandii TaxID=1137989 RepID=A0A6P0GHJ3_9ACTN|nr:S8 family serine peptidase [Geodermatophilus normandii]
MATLSRRTQAVVLVTAAATGFAGAATVVALAAPSVAVADGWGAGDGLDRYVVTADSADAAALLTPLTTLDGVASAQRLSDGRALVATDGLTADDLAAVDGVASVEVSPQVPVLGTVSDPYVPSYGWNLVNTGTNAPGQSAVPDADTDAPDGWAGGTGSGVVVAVVDTGYDSDHEDLAGALWTNPAEPCGTRDTDGNGKVGDCHGWNFTTNSPDVDNGAGGEHGAGVSGAVGARTGNNRGTAGIAPDVTIMPLVIGSGGGVDVILGAEAIRYAADHGADVVNASWGGSMSGAALEYLRSAIAYAGSKGVVVVAAAGNDAADRDRVPVYPAAYAEPNLLTVGASTAADTVSSFSAYGATTVDLFAPGTQVFTTANSGGYELVSGTSIAAPQVAGAVALYRAAFPDLSAADLRSALLADVDPVAAFRGRSVSGGRLTVSGLATAGVGAVEYAFTSMTAAPGTATPRVAVSGTVAPGSFAVILGLGTQYQGSTWAVADVPVVLDGATVTTDDDGQATFSLGARTSLAGLVLAPSMPLGEGRYVLTVQLTRDGAPVGGTRAAPLVVGAPAPAGGGSGGTPTPGTTNPGTTNPGTSNPGTTTPRTPTPGTTTPGAPTPGTTTPGTPNPGSSTPGTTDPGTSNPGTTTPRTPTPGTATPGAPTPGTTTPGTPNPGSSTPGAPTPDTSNPGTTNPGGSTPGTSNPGTSNPGTTTPAPADGGQQTYPGTGTFRITSISPVRVSVAGGTEVRVTGLALPAGARVLVGSSGAATVVRSSTTEVVFRAPARVAGRYDVTVFAPDGRSEVLRSVLEYVAAATGGTTPNPGGGGTTPPPPPGAGSTPAPGGGSGGAAPTAPSEVTGPGALRLVRSARWAAVPASVWSLDCSSSCRGVVLRT